MRFEAENAIRHYGIKRRSGRYPWGSGDTPYQRSLSFQAYVKELEDAGMTQAEIARGIASFDPTATDGFSTAQLRATRSLAKNTKLAEEEAIVRRLRDKGMSATAIGQRMGWNESFVRSVISRMDQDREDVTMSVANMLRSQVNEGRYIDVGLGTETMLGISKEKLNTAIAVLEEEGYSVHKIRVEQVTNPGQYTQVLALVPPGVTSADAQRNRTLTVPIMAQTDDGGRTFDMPGPPVNFDSKRLAIRYGPDGGSEMDGTIELRRGVADISLGGKNFAQVRIAVDGTHYMKGMAVYSDDLPPGVDIRYNTNKDRGTPALGAKDNTVLKNLETKNKDYPFGAIVRSKFYVDADGKKQQSVINTVGSKEGAGEEGAWDNYRKALSSQMLSKQSPILAKEQLDLAYSRNKAEFDNIMKLTNPTVRKKLLDSFSENLDSHAVDLDAAAMPRQKTAVILPIKTLKDNEIYAPNFKNGETVVLIRHPHGGTFEIPELKVNNKNPEGQRMIGKSNPNMNIDAVGINSRVANKLSGADFDGDTVLVIPNNNKRVQSSATLRELQGFDTIRAYPGYEGMKRLEGKQKQTEMGKVSNLITDMTIQKAPAHEIARAVKHSMVVIDAEKHNLNWRLSEQENGIQQLREKYQFNPATGRSGGASTIVSRAKGKVEMPETRLARANEGGPIDLTTGAKRFVPTGRTKIKTTYNEKTDTWTKTRVPVMVKSTRMRETSDARTLVSANRTPMEMVYATHANRTKALANQARLAAYNTPPIKRSPTAAVAYKAQVDSLTAKLNNVYRNKPLERQAQLLARAEFNAITRANRNLDKGDVKKLRTQTLTKYRVRTGAARTAIEITPKEWEAIQAGAISNTKLTQILQKTNDSEIRKYAMPKQPPKMSAAKVSRARMMAARGYTQSEIAEHFGVSTSTLANVLA